MSSVVTDSDDLFVRDGRDFDARVGENWCVVGYDGGGGVGGVRV